MRLRLQSPAVLEAFSPRVPPSKYVANRVLLLAALAAGPTVLHGVPESEDMRAALDFVRAFGAAVEPLASGALLVTGVSARPRFAPGALVDLGESGTLARFALAIAALQGEEVVLDGRGRLRERPMGELLRVLEALGARVSATREGLPVRLRGPLRGGRVRLSGRVTSQFASALLIVGPLLEGGLVLGFEDEPVSASYLGLTVETMTAFGARVHGDPRRGYEVSGAQGYRGGEQRIPPDPTALGYFAALAALFPTTLRHEFPPPPWTGEARALEVIASMGARISVHDGLEVTGTEETLRSPGRVDARDFPDSIPALAALAAVAQGETVFTGVGHLRHKESDRIAALVSELSRLGVEVRAEADALWLRGRPLDPGGEPVFSAHGDHRLAMSLALLSTRLGRVTIDGAESVRKSFPGYWTELGRLGFRVETLQETMRGARHSGESRPT